MNKCDDQVRDLEIKLNIKLPELYFTFLSNISEGEILEIENTGICFFSYSDLVERNVTYEIKEYEPHFFMIGQDGDIGYFINIISSDDDVIYSNDLGAVGSLPMEKVASNIQEFVDNFRL